MTDNQMRDEGVKSLSEILKVNTSVTSLSLSSEWKKKRNTKRMDWRQVLWFLFSDNGIGNEGAKALGETLKTHTILETLYLGSEIHFIRLWHQHNSPQHNHRQQGWWCRSEGIVWWADDEQITDWTETWKWEHDTNKKWWKTGLIDLVCDRKHIWDWRCKCT